MTTNKQIEEQEIRNQSWFLFDLVESMQSKAEQNSDPDKKGYICDEDIVDKINEVLSQLVKQTQKDTLDKAREEKRNEVYRFAKFLNDKQYFTSKKAKNHHRTNILLEASSFLRGEPANMLDKLNQLEKGELI